MNNIKILVFLLLFSNLNFGQNLSSNSTGSFVYSPQSPLDNKLITVFYHIPDGDITTMPIIFSFHSVNRNAEDYRDYSISMANANFEKIKMEIFSKTLKNDFKVSKEHFTRNRKQRFPLIFIIYDEFS